MSGGIGDGIAGVGQATNGGKQTRANVTPLGEMLAPKASIAGTGSSTHFPPATSPSSFLFTPTFSYSGT